MELLSDPAVQAYIAHSAILALKVLAMAFLTIRQRFYKKMFPNVEDAKAAKGKVKLDDPDVERVRRAHFNDLENIPIFCVLGALYFATGPDAAWANLLFRSFTLSRIVHTIVYAVKPMQPYRAMAFFVSTIVNWYMGFKFAAHFDALSILIYFSAFNIRDKINLRTL